MKKLRRRLTLIFLFLVFFSSVASVLLTWMIKNDIFFSKKDIKYLIFGVALKDLFLMLFALIIGILLIFIFSRRTANPILALSKAATEIASGNFNVHVEESDRKDEIGELERQFNRMVRELQSNEYLKKDFISNVSHELKTPLSIIGGYADLLTEDDIPEAERKEYASLIVQESGRLSKLTGNILRLSRLNQEEFPTRHHPFSVDEQLRQCILLLEPKWSEKKLDFRLHLVPFTYSGNEDLFSEVWLNLIDNAIKFSPEGGVIAIAMTAPDRLSCQITIADQGCGMDSATQNRIFEQFYQGDTSHKREGSGLGLSIVSKVLEMHRCTIDVSSTPQKGSVFLITLYPAGQN